jgi:hypothetical protein
MNALLLADINAVTAASVSHADVRLFIAHLARGYRFLSGVRARIIRPSSTGVNDGIVVFFSCVSHLRAS